MTEAALKPTTVFISYSHDSPEHDSYVFALAASLRQVAAGRGLWEKLLLDGFQAAFAGFDPVIIAAFGEADVARLLSS